MTDFEKYVNSEEHSQEIQRTRVGGLGGSDAALVYRVGLNGLAGLTNTDLKRLAVMCGLSEQVDFGGNAYTNAGHKFEDWYEGAGFDNIDMECGEEYQREFVMEQPLAKSFKTFAHADFAEGNFMRPVVIECKFVTTKTTDEVEKTYQAQLQWYYMLGAESVTLAHGTGTVDSAEAGTEFKVEEVKTVRIERDDAFVNILLNGIRTLDGALLGGWLPVVKEKAELTTTPAVVFDAFVKLQSAKLMAEQAKDDEKQAKAVLIEYMDALGYNGIIDPSSGKQVTLVAPKTTSRFDLKTFKTLIAEKAQNCSMCMLTLEDVLETIEEAQKTSTTEQTVMFK